jgi:hypothetical protein
MYYFQMEVQRYDLYGATIMAEIQCCDLYTSLWCHHKYNVVISIHLYGATINTML